MTEKATEKEAGQVLISPGKEVSQVSAPEAREAGEVPEGPNRISSLDTSMDLSLYSDSKWYSPFVGDRTVYGQNVFSMYFFFYIFD